MSVEKWRDTLLPEEATIEQAIAGLIKSGLQVVLVVSGEGVLVGTITDGDIRRGLLRGLGLGSPVTEVIKKDPLVVSHEMDRDIALEVMVAKAITSVPVVDDARRVVGLHWLNELIAPSQTPSIMIVMAGGEGTRLRPHTKNCPKPLLLVKGKPMLEHIIERAKRDGFHQFVFAVRYLGGMIKDYFGNGSRWGVQIDYLNEGSPLGTVGALSLLNPRPKNPILVTNGDILTDINYSKMLDFHCHHDGVAATMAVSLHEWEHPFGVVNTKGIDIVSFEEKPVARSYVNAGVYVLEPRGLDSLVFGEHCDMPLLFNRLQENSERTIVYPIHESWMDLGQMEDYSALNGES
jgi:dTDP-glucose pyrophosphorylase